MLTFDGANFLSAFDLLLRFLKKVAKAQCASHLQQERQNEPEHTLFI